MPSNTTVRAPSKLGLTFTLTQNVTFSCWLHFCFLRPTEKLCQTTLLRVVLQPACSHHFCSIVQKKHAKPGRLIQTCKPHYHSWDQIPWPLLESNKLLRFQTDRRSKTVKLTILQYFINYHYDITLIFQHWTRFVLPLLMYACSFSFMHSSKYLYRSGFVLLTYRFSFLNSGTHAGKTASMTTFSHKIKIKTNE